MVDLTLCLTVELFSDQFRPQHWESSPLLVIHVSHCWMKLSSPLYLPVPWASLSTHKLLLLLQPLWIIRIQLILFQSEPQDGAIPFHQLMREEERTEEINECLVRLTWSAVSQWCSTSSIKSSRDFSPVQTRSGTAVQRSLLPFSSHVNVLEWTHWAPSSHTCTHFYYQVCFLCRFHSSTQRK